MGRATDKDWQKRPSDRQLQEAPKRDSDRAITPTAEVVGVPAYLAPRGYPQAKQLHRSHVQPSLGPSCHSQEKSCIYAAQGHFGHVHLFVTLQTVACQASL